MTICFNYQVESQGQGHRSQKLPLKDRFSLYLSLFFPLFDVIWFVYIILYTQLQ